MPFCSFTPSNIYIYLDAIYIYFQGTVEEPGEGPETEPVAELCSTLYSIYFQRHSIELLLKIYLYTCDERERERENYSPYYATCMMSSNKRKWLNSTLDASSVLCWGVLQP